MGNLFVYSGLTTKIHALKKNLITPAQYVEISQLSSVCELSRYLQEFPAYSDILSETSLEDMHRGELEVVIKDSLYKDFSKIYNFAGLNQRKYLNLYFMKYEVETLKRFLRGLFDNRPDLDVIVHLNDFDIHTNIDTAQVSNSKNIEEFINSLCKTVYYKPLTKVHSLGNSTRFDYELCLDLFRFTYIWQQRKKFFSGDELETITHVYGTKIDLLNILWTYRCKCYYSLSADEIYSYLIPVSYKLKPSQLKELSDAEDKEVFFSAYKNTYYGNRYDLEPFSSLKEMYNFAITDIHRKDYKKDSYSLACVNEYLFLKEIETKKIITATESIRYGCPPDEIIKNINKIGGWQI